ncbi:MAG: PilZ domain-containing protein [Syntrophales bacterium]
MIDKDQSDLLKGQPEAEKLFTPLMFMHKDIVDAIATAQKIDRIRLTNIFNYLHFKGERLYLLVNNGRYPEGILAEIIAEPCLGGRFICRWAKGYEGYKFEQYKFQYLVAFYEQSVILVPAEETVIADGGLSIPIPDIGFAISQRHFPRFVCKGVKAELWQNGFQASGELIDFGPHAFRIRVQAAPPSSFHWYNIDVPASVNLYEGEDVFYSGLCKAMYLKIKGNFREIVLLPMADHIQRFSPKSLRNPRRQSVPPFYAVFEHPFTKKQIKREIFDISTAGFSILDVQAEAILITGMIIPRLSINFADLTNISCKAQVIYHREEGDHIRFGIAILDMDLKNLNCFHQLITNIPGTVQGAINDVDLEQLWGLFFESNFIYPEKYRHLHSFRKSFQRTYKKLYGGSSEVAKHFIYQKNGKIFSHISLIRAYERTWMGHHHAARPEEGKHTGLIVLKLLLGYLYDMHRFPSASLDYYICYYRPGNRFTERIYSGFAKEVANRGLCSTDLFTYLSYQKDKKHLPLTEDWSLCECSNADLFEFKQFYSHYSGGLLLDVLALDDNYSEKSLEKIYFAEGLTRSYKAFSLHYAGVLKAVLIKEESDPAMNLSDLLNGFKIFIMDDKLPPEIVFSAVESLTENCKAEFVPLLLYPAEYAKNNGISSEKQYILWIFDAQIGSEFVAYLSRRYRMKLTEDEK